MTFEQKVPQETNSVNQQVKISTPQVKPIITYILIGITVLFFAAQFIIEYLTGYDWLFILGGKINELILAGQIWRLITPALLHSSILHIGFNMYALYIMGRRLESTYGHARFLLLYFLSAFGGNVLSFVLSDANSLGSSTAIFGLLAAEAVFIFQNRHLFGKRVKNMLINIFMILIINLMIGFSPNTNIDNFGHLGGLLGGFIFGSLGGPKWILEGIAPNISLKDSRPKKEIFFGAIIVFVGFIGMAMIRFLNS
ncbi:MAG: rhomboid family intramembrane serine protease [Anaerolineaceae bacterium]|nr:rhomboid family intramembrane serine protease [Anaerolineaceae bacterium]